MTENGGHILDCSKCPYVNSVKKDVEDVGKDICEVEKALCEKVSFSTFRWIIGALCVAAILVFGWNATEIKSISAKMDCMSEKVVGIDKEVAVIKRLLEK